MEKDKVALILPYNDSLEILFQNRKKISKHGEEFGFFGGHFEEGETIDETLAREAKEELDLDVKNIDVTFFKKFEFEIKEKNLLVERYVFLAKILNLKEIKIFEGEPEYSNFPDIFKLNLRENDRFMLGEIYNLLKK